MFTACISMGHVLDDKTDYSRLIRDSHDFFGKMKNCTVVRFSSTKLASGN